MRASVSRTAVLTWAVVAAVMVVGCAEKPRAGPPPVDIQSQITKNLNPVLQNTVGEFSKLIDSNPVPLEGWGIVAGLPGTGSGDVQPEIRQKLVNQLLRSGARSYIGGTENIDPERILSSNEIAVVEVRGVMPPLARRGTTFDLTVHAIAGTQTTSLANGLLWTTELKVIGLTTAGNDTATAALGRGPVFISKPVELAAGEAPSSQPGATRRAMRDGLVLGGGVVADDRPIRFQVYRADPAMTRAIAQTINTHFPTRDKIAQAENESIITLKIPNEYAMDPQAFIDLTRRFYLASDNPGFTEEKATQLITALHEPGSPQRDISIALQGLGRSILPDFLQPQYTAADPAVRFWCARAGACMQDVGGMIVLQEIIKDRTSPFRMQAVDALVDACRGRDTVRATLSLTDLLNSPNTDDRVLAYQGLSSIRSRIISTYSVGRKFLMDVVPANSPPMIYVTQSDTPRIALIGRPLSLPPGAVYISPDKLLTVAVNETPASADAAAPGKVLTAASVGQNEGPRKDVGTSQGPNGSPNDPVTLYWRSPDGERVVNLRAPANLPEMIAQVTWIPDPRAANYNPNDPYIGASYQRVVEMLAALCHDQIIDAKFVLQPAPVQKPTASDIIRNGRPEGSTMLPPEAPVEPPPSPEPAALPGARPEGPAAPMPGPGL